ncbi:hypothetical protein AN477_01995 [Alicyclobacillus ferrooxydans]|uniref:Uncharacterized protein n=1 Tax=Alicyclobacillus ferrooxydans TaxID=471514 RepID=A0A0P9GWK4_9BACL|nr:hypothetical protein AN477_01995 [Alicyclobacillus ferrooxydans]
MLHEQYWGDSGDEWAYEDAFRMKKDKDDQEVLRTPVTRLISNPKFELPRHVIVLSIPYPHF